MVFFRVSKIWWMSEWCYVFLSFSLCFFFFSQVSKKLNRKFFCESTKKNEGENCIFVYVCVCLSIENERLSLFFFFFLAHRFKTKIIIIRWFDSLDMLIIGFEWKIKSKMNNNRIKNVGDLIINDFTLLLLFFFKLVNLWYFDLDISNYHYRSIDDHADHDSRTWMKLEISMSIKCIHSGVCSTKWNKNQTNPLSAQIFQSHILKIMTKQLKCNKRKKTFYLYIHCNSTATTKNEMNLLKVEFFCCPSMMMMVKVL